MNTVASKPDAHGLMGGLDTMLANTSPHMSPGKDRRESLAESAATFSPHDAAWSGYPFSLEGPTHDGSDAGMHQFFNASSGAVMPPNSAVQSASFSPQSGWPVNDNSGSCTPTPAFDQVSFQQQQQSQADASQAFNPVQLHHPPQLANAGAAAGAVPFQSASPSPKDNWFRMADRMDFQPLPPHKSPLATHFASSTHILRRDGIRKKNARFEIPAERNLRTIDQLINQSTDEQEIKELKQQKRLLRNRQAALDSRQRKKQHTERLEEEKKHYTTTISELDDALHDVRSHEADLLRQKDGWAHAQQQYQQYIDNLVMEKDELIRRHTIETGELRKKCALLSDQMQRMESTAMSTAPSSAGFSTDFGDFEHLTMNSWDEFPISNEFSLEHDGHADVPPALAHPGTIMQKKDHPHHHPHQQPAKVAAAGDDKGVSSGVLLMLLLCGAWVVSRGPKSSSDLMPAVSDEMKTASAAVIDNLYRDSGISLGSASESLRPGDSNLGMVDVEMTGSTSTVQQSSLDHLHRRLVQPTEQQMHDQAFSLTPTQYNDITSGIGQFPPTTSVYEGPRGRTIGEALAADPAPLEGGAGDAGSGSTAEAYTRSVLKGRVSSQVLKEFARMVAVTKHESAGPSIKADPVD